MCSREGRGYRTHPGPQAEIARHGGCCTVRSQSHPRSVADSWRCCARRRVDAGRPASSGSHRHCESTAKSRTSEFRSGSRPSARTMHRMRALPMRSPLAALVPGSPVQPSGEYLDSVPARRRYPGRAVRRRALRGAVHRRRLCARWIGLHGELHQSRSPGSREGATGHALRSQCYGRRRAGIHAQPFRQTGIGSDGGLRASYDTWSPTFMRAGPLTQAAARERLRVLDGSIRRLGSERHDRQPGVQVARVRNAHQIPLE